MWVIRILGVIFYHLEAHREVVQSTAEVCFPPGFVIRELINFPTCYCPGLWRNAERCKHNDSRVENSDLLYIL